MVIGALLFFFGFVTGVETYRRVRKDWPVPLPHPPMVEVPSGHSLTLTMTGPSAPKNGPYR